MKRKQGDSWLPSTTDALYVSSQVAAQLAGVTLLGIALAAILVCRSSTRDPRHLGVADIRLDFSVMLFAGILSLFFVQALLLPNSVKALTALHLATYLVIALARNQTGRLWPRIQLVEFITWINVMLLLTYPIQGLSEWFWYENIGNFRYKSFYFEPSIAALVFVLNVIIIWFSVISPYRKQLLIGANIFCLVLTFSLSGYIMLIAILFTQIRKISMHKFFLGILWLSLILAALFVTENGGQNIEQSIVVRINEILTNEYDNSIKLRTIAPFIFMKDLLEMPINNIFGAGLGGIESLIRINGATFWYLSDFAGDTLTELNNGYVVLIALIGPPIAVIMIVVLGLASYRSHAPLPVKLYMWLYPLFSGFVIHPLIWLVVVMSITQRRDTNIPKINKLINK